MDDNMDLWFQQLAKKILEFCKKYEGQSFGVKEVREVFTPYELAKILCSFYNLRSTEMTVFNFFGSKVDKLDGLFTNDEATELVNEVDFPNKLFKYLSDDVLLSFIVDDKYSSNICDIASCLSSDEAKIKGFNMVKDNSLKVYFVMNFASDDLKVEYLQKIPANMRYMVISSFKDENLIEKNLTFFSRGKGYIIEKFSNDDKKIYYFKKFFKVLTNVDKVHIIASLKDNEQIIYLLSLCNDIVKVEFIKCIIYKDDEFVDKVLQIIKSKRQLGVVLEKYIISNQLVMKHIDKINDRKVLLKIVKNLYFEYGIRYFDRFNDNEIIDVILYQFRLKQDISLKFKSFRYIKNKKLLFELIEHCEEFPEYSDEYEYIIDLYVKKYKLNKERLLFVVSNVSLAILKVLDNPNIIKILNADQDSFEKIMKIFEKDKLKMNSSTMNDILNVLLQREFRIKYQEIILLFPNMLSAIENNDKNYLLEKLSEISQDFSIAGEISKNGWSFEQFIDLLLDKNESAIEVLHTISTKFITNKRNVYVKDNLQRALQQSTVNEYDINDVISNCPVEIIIYFLKNIYKYVPAICLELTEDEQSLIKNKDLIQKIILYRKNPNSYEQIPEDVKNNMKCFNSIFKKVLAMQSTEYFQDFNIDMRICQFREVDSEFLINVMMSLDIDRVDKTLFNDLELFDKFLKIWRQYKIGGWGNTFDLLLNNAGISIDAEVVANFIQYFGLSYEYLQENGNGHNLSLTALIDLANCYSLESDKYSIVFGTENFKYIASNPSPNVSSMPKENRIKIALSFLKTIRTRKYVTVPPIDCDFSLKSGKKINIVVGNFSNIINLTYGERTGSCMRIGGAGYSLFEFCLKNNNGFHIRFSDPNTGKFVSRVSGFRNGNMVFLNQLRYSKDSNYTDNDVVEACQLIASELIELSKNSSFPIDNVVISPYYAMEKSDMQSEDLGILDPRLGMQDFYTDVKSSAIILATSKQNNELVTPKLGVNEVYMYPVKRDKQRILYNRECQKCVVHLKSLDQLLSGCSIDAIDVEINPNLVVCFAGEDWCITVDRDGNLEEYIMKNTNDRQQAIDEMQCALIYLKENLEKEIMASMSFGM